MGSPADIPPNPPHPHPDHLVSAAPVADSHRPLTAAAALHPVPRLAEDGAVHRPWPPAAGDPDGVSSAETR